MGKSIFVSFLMIIFVFGGATGCKKRIPLESGSSVVKNIGSLEALKKSAGEKNKSEYTKESWDKYQKALSAALALPESTEEEIAAKKRAIEKALSLLVSVKTKDALEAAKKSAGEKNKSEYTKESWDKYQEALSAALALPESTEEEIAAKKRAIEKALSLLVKVSKGAVSENGDNSSGSFNPADTQSLNMGTYLTISYEAGVGNTVGSVPVDTNKYPSNGGAKVGANSGALAGEIIRDGIRQRFKKWNTAPDGSGQDYLPGATFTIVDNVTLYAIYTTDDTVLRKVGVAGGWVFYDAGSVQSWGRYLEAANGDLISSLWGKSKFVDGADGVAIGTGKQNTLDIVKGDIYTENKAADLCDNYTVTYCGVTYDDWFLPSKDELNKLYINMGSGKDENGTTYPIAGFLTTGYYWSSSESSTDDRLAWLQYFKLGPQHSYYKHSSYCVRAIRAF